MNREIKIGDILINRYRIIEICGQGGMGRVYRAKDLIAEIDVAVKLIPPEVSVSRDEMVAVKKNFILIQKLNHPNIAALKQLEYIPETREYFIVMEYVRGVTLAAYRRGKKDRVIAVEEAFRICRKVADGLDHAHSKHLIHLDIKPDNVMITEENEVKILDFGLAMQIKTSSMNLSKEIGKAVIAGTPRYMAPETWEGGKQDKATDVYALGILFYEMIEGRPPFVNPDRLVLMEIVLKRKPELPKILSRSQGRALAKALAKEGKHRFQSAGEFARELQRENIPNPAKRNYAQAAVVVILIIATTWLIIDFVRDRTPKWITEELARQLAESKPGGEKIPIVVGGISGERAPYPLAVVLSRMFDSEPALYNAFTVLERNGLKAVYREVGKEVGDVFQPADIRKFGSMTSAEGVLVGDITEFGGTVRISVRLVDPFDTKRICAASVDVPKWRIPEEFLACIGSVAKPDMVEENNGVKWKHTAALLLMIFFAASVTAYLYNSKNERNGNGVNRKKIPSADDVPKVQAKKGRLVILVEPGNAKIRVLNIKERFSQGMRLLPGSYRIEVSAAGYEVHRDRISLAAGEDKEVKIRLERSGPEKRFTNSLGMEFVYIKPGSFMMGSPASEEGRRDNEIQHQVTLTQGYYLQTTEVTQGQWQAVMGNNPSNFTDCGKNCPVERVSYHEAQEFIDRLNQRENGRKYRLPTEAEWECACRAGTTSPFSFGETLSTDQANYFGAIPYGNGPKGVYRGKTTRVKSFPANAWGLYDMHGNVWEWCQDWYGDYLKGSVTDPKGPSSGADRILRGGCWGDVPRNCRSADRGRNNPGYRNSGSGFRLAAPLFSR